MRHSYSSTRNFSSNWSWGGRNFCDVIPIHLRLRLQRLGPLWQCRPSRALLHQLTRDTVMVFQLHTILHPYTRAHWGEPERTPHKREWTAWMKYMVRRSLVTHCPMSVIPYIYNMLYISLVIIIIIAAIVSYDYCVATPTAWCSSWSLYSILWLIIKPSTVHCHTWFH